MANKTIPQIEKESDKMVNDCQEEYIKLIDV